jgi:hypothetical protein
VKEEVSRFSLRDSDKRSADVGCSRAGATMQANEIAAFALRACKLKPLFYSENPVQTSAGEERLGKSRHAEFAQIRHNTH